MFYDGNNSNFDSLLTIFDTETYKFKSYIVPDSLDSVLLKQFTDFSLQKLNFNIHLSFGQRMMAEAAEMM